MLLSACGATARPRGSSAIDYRPHAPKSSVTPLADRREHRALREAAALLRSVSVPPGSIRLWREPAGDPNDLEHAELGVSTVNMTADRWAFWQLPGSGRSLLAFERRHMPAGFRGTGRGSSPNGVWWTEFDSPSHGWSSTHAVGFTVVPLGNRTILRIDAGVAWIYPRSPSEVVPAGVREVDVHGAGVDRRVTDRAQVAQIVRWFDALNAYQPGPSVGCMAVLSLNVDFVFRSATGRQLATALVRSGQADNCSPIEFSVGGKRQTPLIDSSFGQHTFASRVQRLLGVRFRVPKPGSR